MIKITMDTKTKVAVVTGGNKGVGFGIARTLCKQFDGDVILTARDVGRGQEAVRELEKEGLKPKFHQLDITDHESVVKLEEYLKKNYGGLDVLVNNAGLCYKFKLIHGEGAPFGEQVETITKCNFFGTLDVCNVLFPLLRPHARVCNVSSIESIHALSICPEEKYRRFIDPNISMEELESIFHQFIETAKVDKHREAGFPHYAYGTSKIGVTVMSIIQQRELDAQGSPDIVVNACCPGFVDTDMSFHMGYKTIDEGAETPVYLAMLPPDVDSPRGNFLMDKQVHPWDRTPLYKRVLSFMKFVTKFVLKKITNTFGSFF